MRTPIAAAMSASSSAVTLRTPPSILFTTVRSRPTVRPRSSWLRSARLRASRMRSPSVCASMSATVRLSHILADAWWTYLRSRSGGSGLEDCYERAYELAHGGFWLASVVLGRDDRSTVVQIPHAYEQS